jgi:DNA-binding transcriptional ArsR family regulator
MTDERLGATPDPDVDPSDPRALRGLAHPLRLRILGLLRSDGPSTATRLAATLGESSGATSYHVRQLAEHGFVVADDAHGDRGRERWWRAAHRYTDLPRTEAREGHAGAEGFLRALAADVHRDTADFVDRIESLPQEWQEGWTIADRFLRLTPAEARRLREELAQLTASFRLNRPDGNPGAPADAELVHVQVQILPRPGSS